MRIVLQRVKQASVRVNDEIVGAIDTGLLLFVGFGNDDRPSLPETGPWKKLIAKIPGLRIFPDEKGKMNQSLQDIQGSVLAVSQFTLFGDCSKGRRPSFIHAAEPELAQSLYNRFVEDLKQHIPGKVKSGVFAAEMEISLINWGPVTLLLNIEY